MELNVHLSQTSNGHFVCETIVSVFEMCLVKFGDF